VENTERERDAYKELLEQMETKMKELRDINEALQAEVSQAKSESDRQSMEVRKLKDENLALKLHIKELECAPVATVRGQAKQPDAQAKRAKEDAATKRLAEEEAKKQADAKRLAEQEAQKLAEQEAKKQAEAKRLAEQEAQKLAEEKSRLEQAEAKRLNDEEEAKKRAEEMETKRLAEIERLEQLEKAKQAKQQEDAQRRAEEQRRKQEEAAQQAAEKARRQEKEKKRQEERQRKAEEMKKAQEQAEKAEREAKLAEKKAEEERLAAVNKAHEAELAATREKKLQEEAAKQEEKRKRKEAAEALRLQQEAEKEALKIQQEKAKKKAHKQKLKTLANEAKVQQDFEQSKINAVKLSVLGRTYLEKIIDQSARNQVKVTRSFNPTTYTITIPGHTEQLVYVENYTKEEVNYTASGEMISYIIIDRVDSASFFQNRNIIRLRIHWKEDGPIQISIMEPDARDEEGVREFVRSVMPRPHVLGTSEEQTEKQAVEEEVFARRKVLNCDHCQRPGTRQSLTVIELFLYCESCKDLYKTISKKLDAITDVLADRFMEEGIITKHEQCSFQIHYSGVPLEYIFKSPGYEPITYQETRELEVKPTKVTLVRTDKEYFFKNDSPIVLKFTYDEITDEYFVFAEKPKAFITLTCHHCKLPVTEEGFVEISTKLFCKKCKALFKFMPQKLVAISAALEYRLLEEGVYLSVDDIEIFSIDIHGNPVVYNIKIGARSLTYQETAKVEEKPDVMLLKRLDSEDFFKNRSQIELMLINLDGNRVVVPVTSQGENEFFHKEYDESTKLE